MKRNLYIFLNNKKAFISPVGAFTLIELLVVISIIGMLSSFVLLSMSGKTEKARIAKGLQFSGSVHDVLGYELVGAWMFDEGSGTTAYDVSGYGNNGVLRYGTAFDNSDTPSSKGASVKFDGIDDDIRIPNTLKFQTIHGHSTVELWFKALDLSGTKFMFSDNCNELAIWHNGTTINGQVYASLSGGTISTNKWYHVVLTHAHSTGLTNTEIKLYLDGELKNESQYTIITQNGYNDNPFWIGNDDCNPGRNFNGLVDDVRIYSVALSSAEIQQHYVQGLESHQNLVVNE